MLIIVNPYATTVSDRLKNLVVYALQARYDVEAVDTKAAEHAIEIGRKHALARIDQLTDEQVELLLRETLAERTQN